MSLINIALFKLIVTLVQILVNVSLLIKALISSHFQVFREDHRIFSLLPPLICKIFRWPSEYRALLMPLLLSLPIATAPSFSLGSLVRINQGLLIVFSVRKFQLFDFFSLLLCSFQTLLWLSHFFSFFPASCFRLNLFFYLETKCWLYVLYFSFSINEVKVGNFPLDWDLQQGNGILA